MIGEPPAGTAGDVAAAGAARVAGGGVPDGSSPTGSSSTGGWADGWADTAQPAAPAVTTWVDAAPAGRVDPWAARPRPTITGRAVTVVLVPFGEMGLRLLDTAQEWADANLITSAAWVRPEDVDVTPGRAPTVSAFVLTPAAETGAPSGAEPVAVDLFALLATERRELVRLVVAQVLDHSAGDLAQLDVGRDLRDALEQSLPIRRRAASGVEHGTHLLPLNVVTGVTGLAGLPTDILADDWDLNIVTSPEDRPDPQRASVFVRDPGNLVPIAMLSVATVGGIVTGIGEGPFDDPQSIGTTVQGRIIVVRPIGRVVRAERVIDGLAREVLAETQERAAMLRVVDDVRACPDPRRLVADVVEELRDLDGGAMRLHPPTPTTAPRDTVLGYRQAQLAVLTAWGEGMARVPRFLWETTKQEFITRLDRKVAGTGARVVRYPQFHQAMPRPEELERAKKDVRLQLRNNDVPGVAPEVFGAIRQVSLALLDGGTFPEGVTEPVSARMREILPDARDVVPHPAARFVPDAGYVDVERLDPPPPFDADPTAAAEPAAGPSLAEALRRLNGPTGWCDPAAARVVLDALAAADARSEERAAQARAVLSAAHKADPATVTQAVAASAPPPAVPSTTPTPPGPPPGAGTPAAPAPGTPAQITPAPATPTQGTPTQGTAAPPADDAWQEAVAEAVADVQREEESARLRARLREEVETWVADRDRALLWQLRDAVQHDREQARELADRANDRVNAAVAPGDGPLGRAWARMVLWTAVWVTLLITAGVQLIYPTSMSREAMRDGFSPGWPEFIPGLVILLIGLVVMRQSMLRWFRARQQFRRTVDQWRLDRQHDVESHGTMLLAERRLASLEPRLAEWCDVIGWTVHRPWGDPPRIPERRSDLADCLPAALVVSQTAPPSMRREHAAQAIARDAASSRGWRLRHFERLIRLATGCPPVAEMVLAEIAELERSEATGPTMPRGRFISAMVAGDVPRRARAEAEAEVSAKVRAAHLRDRLFVVVDGGHQREVPDFLGDLLTPPSDLAAELWSDEARRVGTPAKLRSIVWTPVVAPSRAGAGGAGPNTQIRRPRRTSAAAVDVALRVDLTQPLERSDLLLFQQVVRPDPAYIDEPTEDWF